MIQVHKSVQVDAVQGSMAEPSSDVQDPTSEHSGSESPAAGTNARVVKKRGILDYLSKGINKVVAKFSPDKAAPSTTAPRCRR